jgi:hypothetical protein
MDKAADRDGKTCYGTLNLSGIHWVIVGGESGAGARPMHKEWVLSIRDQCRAPAVLFFFKQWGGVRKGKTGRAIDGVTFDEMPSRADNPMPRRQRRMALVKEVHASLPAAILAEAECLSVQ